MGYMKRKLDRLGNPKAEPVPSETMGLPVPTPTISNGICSRCNGRGKILVDVLHIRWEDCPECSAAAVLESYAEGAWEAQDDPQCAQAQPDPVCDTAASGSHGHSMAGQALGGVLTPQGQKIAEAMASQKQQIGWPKSQADSYEQQKKDLEEVKEFVKALNNI